jgi:hypothetical protein
MLWCTLFVIIWRNQKYSGANVFPYFFYCSSLLHYRPGNSCVFSGNAYLYNGTTDIGKKKIFTESPDILFFNIEPGRRVSFGCAFHAKMKKAMELITMPSRQTGNNAGLVLAGVVGPAAHGRRCV